MNDASHRLLLIDTHLPGHRGSMARYANLVEQSLVASAATQAWQISRLRLGWPFRLPAWLPAGFEIWLNHLWILLTGPRRVRRAAPRWVHLLDGSHAYLLRRLRGTTATATVHDLIPALERIGRFGPGGVSRLARVLIDASVGGLRQCRHLLAVSANTAEDLAEIAAIARDRVSVVPNALEPALLRRSVHDAEATDDKGSPFILHLGNNAAYKNRVGVVRIFSRMAASADTRLVMGGPAPSPEVRALVAKLELEDRVDFVEIPDDASLIELFSNASVFLFPSLYEGFGWPPLEAMACGCPVVCSNAASLPEVVGDAALTAEPGDEQALADLCLQLIEDPDLARRQAAKGRERAAAFTLERMGRQLVEFYRQVLDD